MIKLRTIALNETELKILLSNVKLDILNHYNDKKHITEIILFGSYAKGTQNKNSDVDVLVIFKDQLSQIPDILFSEEIRKKYKSLLDIQIHMVFEKEEYYKNSVEEFYKDVPKYGKVI